METSTDSKPSLITCSCHQRSKAITIHKNGGGAAAAASSSSDQLRKGLSKKTKRMSVLPDEIIHFEILTRLPAKYVLRFKLVCKSWNVLFKSSDFVESHLARLHSYQCKNDEDLIIAKSGAYVRQIHIISHTSTIIVRPAPSFTCFFLGSINGLVCTSSNKGKFSLWNPATAQLKQFFLQSQHPDNCLHLVGGLSWDHKQNDYKVVLVCQDTLISSPKQLLIYSTNSATWTDQLLMPDSLFPNGRSHTRVFTRPPSTIVKGIPYWRYKQYLLLPGKKCRRRTASVFKFLPENNEFRLLPDLDIYGKKFNIVNINESLFGMAYKRGRKDSSVVIYSLDEETQSGVWSKMYTIGPIDLSLKTRRLSQCFKNGGEILIAQKYLGVGSFYDPKTKQTTVLEGKEHDLKHCFSYTPSLARVQGMVPIQQLYI